jgi:hypothetical protein
MLVAAKLMRSVQLLSQFEHILTRTYEAMDGQELPLNLAPRLIHCTAEAEPHCHLSTMDWYCASLKSDAIRASSVEGVESRSEGSTLQDTYIFGSRHLTSITSTTTIPTILTQQQTTTIDKYLQFHHKESSLFKPHKVINYRANMIFPNSAILATAITLLIPTLTSASVLTPLPRRAPAIDLAFQPVMDFDTDSCYNAPAIDAKGVTNKGLSTSGWKVKQCRTAQHLLQNQVYSRRMCNRGWCAIIYAYYFEVDSFDAVVHNFGHRHDWEHVVVWVKGTNAKYVATSAHGNYELHNSQDVRLFGKSSPKIVYHMDYKRTRNMRIAKKNDDPVENALGAWILGSLVSYDGFPSPAIRNKLMETNWGSAHMDMTDQQFARNLVKSMPKEARDDHFDCAYHDGSWDLQERRDAEDVVDLTAFSFDNESRSLDDDSQSEGDVYKSPNDLSQAEDEEPEVENDESQADEGLQAGKVKRNFFA